MLGESEIFQENKYFRKVQIMTKNYLNTVTKNLSLVLHFNSVEFSSTTATDSKYVSKHSEGKFKLTIEADSKSI